VELGVVGGSEFCLGFRLVGIRHVFEVDEDGDAEETVQRAIAEEDVGILVLPSELLPRLRPQTRSNLTASVRPVAIPIGMTEGTDLREKIKQAVGVDLWAKEAPARRGGADKDAERGADKVDKAKG
jgi:V/A-type H+-transporting ATPase subunit F